jgi:hypothetical protein
MIDVQTMIQAMDEMPIEAVEKIHRYTAERLQSSYFILSDESVKAIQQSLAPLHQAILEEGITEEEINQLIDAELAEARRERQAHRRY